MTDATLFTDSDVEWHQRATHVSKWIIRPYNGKQPLPYGWVGAPVAQRQGMAQDIGQVSQKNLFSKKRFFIA